MSQYYAKRLLELFMLDHLAQRARLVRLLIILAFCIPSSIAAADTPAESFVQNNIKTGLSILNDRQLSTAQRNAQFESFLLGVTDMKRIALFTLGSYTRT